MSRSASETDFSAAEREVLRQVQGNLPDSPTPYADLARMSGLTEDEVIGLLQAMRNKGYIRRFGATLRHQQAGYGANAMVAWFVEDEANPDKVGEVMAGRPEISHCYLRRNCYDWPYNLYTMIHGRAQDDCVRLAEELSRETGITQYEILFSYEELKKTSMQYF